ARYLTRPPEGTRTIGNPPWHGGCGLARRGMGPPRGPRQTCVSTAYASMSADDAALTTMSMCCTRERGTSNEPTYPSCHRLRRTRCASLVTASWSPDCPLCGQRRDV